MFLCPSSRYQHMHEPHFKEIIIIIWKKNEMCNHCTQNMSFSMNCERTRELEYTHRERFEAINK